MKLYVSTVFMLIMYAIGLCGSRLKTINVYYASNYLTKKRKRGKGKGSSSSPQRKIWSEARYGVSLTTFSG